MCIEALNNKINILEIRVKTIEQKLEHANLDPQKCYDQFKNFEDNFNSMMEMQRAELTFLEGLGNHLNYKPNAFTEEELGIGREESVKGGEKQNE